MPDDRPRFSPFAGRKITIHNTESYGTYPNNLLRPVNEQHISGRIVEESSEDEGSKHKGNRAKLSPVHQHGNKKEEAADEQQEEDKKEEKEEARTVKDDQEQEEEERKAEEETEQEEEEGEKKEQEERKSQGGRFQKSQRKEPAENQRDRLSKGKRTKENKGKEKGKEKEKEKENDKDHQLIPMRQDIPNDDVELKKHEAARLARQEHYVTSGLGIALGTALIVYSVTTLLRHTEKREHIDKRIKDEAWPWIKMVTSEMRMVKNLQAILPNVHFH